MSGGSTARARQLSAEEQTLRLEHFLDSVLRKTLHDVLLQRDELFSLASSCVQLRQLLQSMRHLSSVDVSHPPQPNSGSGDAPSSSQPALRPTRTLVDLGHRFFMQAEIKDPSIVRINIGCGVVVPMNHAEAETFLIKKEASLTELAKLKTRESLRIKFRIRLVMEAIMRLQSPS